MRAFFRTAGACAAALSIWCGNAVAADNYPSQPLRIMVGSPPGGGTDILARLLAAQFNKSLGQPVVVENRPGASNTIAADMTARADKDGLTLLLATTTAQAIAPHLMKLKFDPLRDLQPIGLVAVMPNVLVVPANAPYQDTHALVQAMRERPEGFRYGSSGVGSTQHVGGVAFTAATGTQASHIPYKGSAQALIDIMGGQIEMMFDTTSSSLSQIRAGKLRALAVSAPQRSPELPQVPTLAEQGIEGADVITWYALYTTAGTAPTIVQTLSRELQAVLATDEARARIADMGGEIRAMSVDEFAKFNQQEYDRYGQLVAETALQAQ